MTYNLTDKGKLTVTAIASQKVPRFKKYFELSKLVSFRVVNKFFWQEMTSWHIRSRGSG